MTRQHVDPPAGPEQQSLALDESTIQARFLQFHRSNPQVYDLLVRFARTARGRGYQRFGIAAVWERMRWEAAMTWGEDAYTGLKLNNDYRSRYARLIMDQEPDLAGFFETRRLRAE